MSNLDGGVYEACCSLLVQCSADWVGRLSQTRASRQTPGFGDLFFVWGRQAVWVETKRPGQKQSQAQATFQAAVEQAGNVYLLIDDVNQLADWLIANKRADRLSTGELLMRAARRDEALARAGTAGLLG